MSQPDEVAIFGSSTTAPGTDGWSEAESIGMTLAEAGFGVITGGYGGTMEAVSKGAHSAGGHVVGVTAPAVFPERHGANPYVTELIEATTLNDRIRVMVERAAGALVLPGSVGTAAELLIAWNWNHIARRNGSRLIPTVAIGATWAEIARILVERADAHPGDLHLESTASAGLAWLLEQLENR